MSITPSTISTNANYLMAFLVVALLSLTILCPGPAGAESVTPVRQNELINMLRHDCGACHGITLKGGIGPALTRQALAERSDTLLIDTILQGRPGTAMPPWEGLLSPEEVAWLVAQLRHGFSNNLSDSYLGISSE